MPCAALLLASLAALSPTQRLARDGFAVFDGVLSREQTAAVRETAEALRSGGAMRNLGQDGRDDEVLTVDLGMLRDPSYSGLMDAARVLAGMPGMLVESGRRDECAAETAAQFASASTPRLLMLARYPPSAGGYVPHLDNDAADPDHQRGPVGLRACDRVYTCILYLQSGWSEADDGRLRLHRPRGRAERGEAAAAAVEEEEEEGWAFAGRDYVDVEPVGGRLVVFDSRRMLHEVRPSFAPRWALTAWI
ncbi:hypothetical protein EMIHUDRAFT_351499 [Emiliania huxleyi CCMP1516]|uniref:Fe2OG dioxygenase domain-containing protein n=2 Tax=Emiliania huxleyi TaxID=2903 RepID=A0A0D3KV32_EMIH1|nr:hypothetical protein EMIHUDRAFT_351499 [Emiliania huxleyi CCMP1516]EOD39617.1 hypothetical protein EMIHUDRAFT_351499 [Emiliania huxleyi CCMP1516]|eukprot:XP_005792046.1 hypothetical protein EMIHUDRAFT_351499 [Emiliania huxleyi CCMP1516]